MNTSDLNEREMERLLERHFTSGADNVPPTPDLWSSLEGRLGEQDSKPLWAGLRDWVYPPGGFNGVAPLAAAAAVMVVAAAGSVWFVYQNVIDQPSPADFSGNYMGPPSRSTLSPV